MTSETLALALLVAPLATTAALAVAPLRIVARAAILGAAITAGLGVAVAAVALANPNHAFRGAWLIVDAAGGLLVGVIAVVGLATVLVSPAYLETARGSLVSAVWRVRIYYILLFAFWAVLLAVPLAGNLGAAWLAVEATTAASALLVGFSGKPRALEAGWKYLVLTSLGLGVALLGIVLLAAGVPSAGSARSPGRLSARTRQGASPR